MDTTYSQVLFIHHSTGANLIKEGKLRDKLRKINPNINLWDHSYSLYKLFPKIMANFTYHTGLSDPDGKIIGKDYNIVLSNNSPKEYADIFSRDPGDTTLSSILKYDVVAFKNCYPTTHIRTDRQLRLYKKYYEQIHDSLTRYPNKKFILVTPPPLRAFMTKTKYAKRAQNLVIWLNSRGFKKDTKNIYIFDLFNLLANDEGTLQKKYCKILRIDSHPNKRANRDIAPKFAKFINEVCNMQIVDGVANNNQKKRRWFNLFG